MKECKTGRTEHIWGNEKCIQDFTVGKLEGMRSFGRSRNRWKDNVKIDL
jgi:hypothetical protein